MFSCLECVFPDFVLNACACLMSCCPFFSSILWERTRFKLEVGLTDEALAFPPSTGGPGGACAVSGQPGAGAGWVEVPIVNALPAVG